MQAISMTVVVLWNPRRHAETGVTPAAGAAEQRKRPFTRGPGKVSSHAIPKPGARVKVPAKRIRFFRVSKEVVTVLKEQTEVRVPL